MITIALCDDSKTMIENLKLFLEEYGRESGKELHIFTFYSGEELLQNFNGKYDIIFLDIKMPGMNGVQAAKKVREKDRKVIIIFLTSLIQYALEGYKVNAANYIVKPVTKKRLKLEMERCLQEIEQQEDPFIVFHNDNGNYKILLKTISYIETYNRNLLIHTDKGNIVCYWKMKEMEEKIKDYGFSRNHASYIVNLFYVENIEKMDIKLSTGERLPISKTKKKEFMEGLAEYWGKQI
uniref:LytR/AlgR family response regulator transcription factor n=1 Tax=Agathobacter sp. TaxID=2021311 RepID=UPI004055EA10